MRSQAIHEKIFTSNVQKSILEKLKILTKRHLATVRAALLFWREEIAAHDPHVAIPYFDEDAIQPLEAAEVEQLRQRFASIRYVAYDPRSDSLKSAELFHGSSEAALSVRQDEIATLILPGGQVIEG